MANIKKADLTMMADLLDPEVLLAMLGPKFAGRLKFLDVMGIDYTLEGQPGSTVTIPRYKYIGKATKLPEGDEVAIAKLAYEKVSYTIMKYAKGVGLTDEDLLQAFGAPLNQAIEQLAYSIADAINEAVGEALASAVLTSEYDQLNGDAIVDALVLFGEDDTEAKFLYVNPVDLADLRKNADFLAYTEAGVNAQRTGALGNIWGCEVVDSNLVPAGVQYIVKRGYVTWFTKRDTQIETGRVQERFSWLVTANKHGVVAITDEGNCIKLTKKEIGE